MSPKVAIAIPALALIAFSERTSPAMATTGSAINATRIAISEYISISDSTFHLRLNTALRPENTVVSLMRGGFGGLRFGW